MGFGESVADYGPAFFCTVGVAWSFGLAGYYVALRLLGDARAAPTVIVLAVLLPASALSVQTLGQALADAFDWTFGLLIPLSIVLYISCVVGPPIAARLIASFFQKATTVPKLGLCRRPRGPSRE